MPGWLQLIKQRRNDLFADAGSSTSQKPETKVSQRRDVEWRTSVWRTLPGIERIKSVKRNHKKCTCTLVFNASNNVTNLVPRRTKLTLEQLNALPVSEFHKTFENVVECWPEAAIFCSAMLPFKSFEAMIVTFENYLHRLSTENKLRILRLHPDLAGRLLDVQQLTEESSYEQSSVGLDKLTPEDKRQITALNEEYD